MTSLRIASPAPATATPSPAPVPQRPETPAEILALADKPLFRGEYTATERDSWRVGMPLLGTKVTSERPVTFSNDFNILRTSGPMVGYSSSSYQDALRAARDLAFDWSDPALGGQIYASVGVAVLQASDGNYFHALVGSGNPQTSTSALGYRSDRFDSNIYGSFKRSTDAKATGPWSAPVDKDGTVVDTPGKDDAAAITRRHVEDVKVERFVPATPMLKAIVDVRNVFEIEPAPAG